jgi:hypothetical protein
MGTLLRLNIYIYLKSLQFALLQSCTFFGSSSTVGGAISRDAFGAYTCGPIDFCVVATNLNRAKLHACAVPAVTFEHILRLWCSPLRHLSLDS